MEKIDNKILGLQIGFALELFKTGKYKESLIQYEYIINNYKFDFPEIYIAYGNSLFAVSRFDDAIINYKKALSKNDKLSDAAIGLGKTYIEKKDYKKAEKIFSNLVEEEASLTAANFLAYVYEKQERFNEAEYLYVTILENNNNLHEVWNNLALFYKVCRNNEDKAISSHKKSLEIEQKLEYLQNYTLTLLDFNHPKEALEIITKCLEMDSNNEKTKEYLKIATRELTKS